MMTLWDFWENVTDIERFKERLHKPSVICSDVPTLMETISYYASSSSHGGGFIFVPMFDGDAEFPMETIVNIKQRLDGEIIRKLSSRPLDMAATTVVFCTRKGALSERFRRLFDEPPLHPKHLQGLE